MLIQLDRKKQLHKIAIQIIKMIQLLINKEEP
jgi:hypothetical protein